MGSCSPLCGVPTRPQLAHQGGGGGGGGREWEWSVGGADLCRDAVPPERNTHWRTNAIFAHVLTIF